MRTSEFLLSTLKETPSDAEVVSHQLMLRAGLIRRVAAGIYNWMPLGLRVLRRVEQIVREAPEASSYRCRRRLGGSTRPVASADG